MKNVASKRSVIVASANDGYAEVWASQPSDCRVLDKGHIKYPEVGNLTVKFNEPFMHSINGPGESESLEEWHSAIQHLLHTYRPKQMYVIFGNERPRIQSGFIVDLPDGSNYCGMRTLNKDVLRLFW